MSQSTSHRRRLAVSASVTVAGAAPSMAAVSARPRRGPGQRTGPFPADQDRAAPRRPPGRRPPADPPRRRLPSDPRHDSQHHLPSSLEIGSSSTVVPFRTTVQSSAGYTNPFGAVGLVVGGRYIADFLAYLTPGQTTFHGTFLLDTNVVALGTGYWITAIGDESSGAKPQEATVAVTPPPPDRRGPPDCSGPPCTRRRRDRRR
jgi:hypothetical protein